MTKENKVKLATNDGKPVSFPAPLVSAPKRPTGSAGFVTYSLKENLKTKDFAANWHAFFGRADRTQQLIANPRRMQRQNGKILEAQEFRKMQGCFLEVRLHAIKMAQTKVFGLRWWFQNHDRIWLHHFIMANYYLRDRPTTEAEILSGARASDKTIRGILKTACEMGSLDVDKVEGDRRAKCYYPTRGMVSDTDNFFNSQDPENRGVFTELKRLLTSAFGTKRYSLDRYERDVAEFRSLVKELMEKAGSEPDDHK